MARPTLLLLVGAVELRQAILTKVAWLARRLQAMVAVTAFVERTPGVDALDLEYIRRARQASQRSPGSSGRGRAVAPRLP
ncbi:MAG: hypothetical protein ACREQM_02790 [Candidatus Dormibacteraceae bacterium]